jgi:hypothetical protein
MCYGEILSNQVQRARKAHRCGGCRHPIRPGADYQKVTQRDGRDFLTGRWHRHCAAKAHAVARVVGADQCEIDRESERETAKDLGWRAFLGETRERLRDILSR